MTFFFLIQAAGTLNKPTTIVPTASAPSANSRVNAQQTVKDVVVTKKESENVNFIICDVCNVTCNSQTAFKIHKNGKKHLKNTQKILVLSSAIKQETPSSVAKDTKQDLLQKEGTVNPLFVCDIPDMATFLNQKKLTEMVYLNKVTIFSIKTTFNLLVFLYLMFLFSFCNLRFSPYSMAH